LVRRQHVGLLLPIFTHSYGCLQLKIFLLEYATLIFAIHRRRYSCVIRLWCMNLMGLCTIKDTHIAMSKALIELRTIWWSAKEIVILLWALEESNLWLLKTTTVGSIYNPPSSSFVCCWIWRILRNIVQLCFAYRAWFRCYLIDWVSWKSRAFWEIWSVLLDINCIAVMIVTVFIIIPLEMIIVIW
jgi:hypothetical protein